MLVAHDVSMATKTIALFLNARFRPTGIFVVAGRHDAAERIYQHSANVTFNALRTTGHCIGLLHVDLCLGEISAPSSTSQSDQVIYSMEVIFHRSVVE